MLDLYIGECRISIININISIKEPTRGYQIVILVNFYILWISQGERILVYLRHYLGWYNSKPYWYYTNFLRRMNGIHTRILYEKRHHQNSCPNSIKKIWNLHHKYLNGIKRKRKKDTNPTLVHTSYTISTSFPRLWM